MPKKNQKSQKAKKSNKNGQQQQSMPPKAVEFFPEIVDIERQLDECCEKAKILSEKAISMNDDMVSLSNKITSLQRFVLDAAAGGKINDAFDEK